MRMIIKLVSRGETCYNIKLDYFVTQVHSIRSADTSNMHACSRHAVNLRILFKSY